MKKKVHLLPVALAFLIGLGTVGCGSKQEPAGTAPETVTSGVSEEESTKQETESQTAEEVPAYPVGSWDDDYILPDAQTHIYTQEELSSLTREELRIARNEQGV